MGNERKKTFFRVQSSSESEQCRPLRAQRFPSGKLVVSMRRETFASAKRASARIMAEIRNNRSD